MPKKLNGQLAKEEGEKLNIWYCGLFRVALSQNAIFISSKKRIMRIIGVGVDWGTMYT